MSGIRKSDCVKYILAFAVLSCVAVFGFYPTVCDMLLAHSLSAYEVLEPGTGWWTDTGIIRHAGGGIDGLPHSNSKEAVEQSLAAGERFLELDFSFTSDGHLAAMHQWGVQWDGTVPDYGTFMDGVIFGKYTPLDVESAMAYMSEYPDLFLLIDTKETGDAFYDVVDAVIAACPDTDRLVFYVYGAGQKGRLQLLYGLSDDQFVMLDRDYDDYDQMLADCYADGIFIACMDYTSCGAYVLHDFISRGFITYVYTVNRIDHLELLVDGYGITGIVTDFLTGDDYASVCG